MTITAEKEGIITQVIGPVIDVEFESGVLPEINDAIEIIVDDKCYTLMSYRVHKGFDMVTLDGYRDINDVLFLMKKDVYFDKDKLSLEDNEILDEDLVTYTLLTKDGRRGIIKEIFYASENNKILRIELDHEVLIPWNSPMILEINKKEKCVLIELIEGM